MVDIIGALVIFCINIIFYLCQSSYLHLTRIFVRMALQFYPKLGSDKA